MAKAMALGSVAVTATVEIALILPFADTVITGECVALPYVCDGEIVIFVTSVLAIAKAACAVACDVLAKALATLSIAEPPDIVFAKANEALACIKAAVILLFCVVSIAVAKLAAAKALFA